MTQTQGTQNFITCILLAFLFCASMALPHPAAASGAQTCLDQDVTFYFASGETRLNSENEKLARYVAERAEGCDIVNLQIDGFADASDDAENDDTPKARAQAALQEFVQNGIRPQQVELGAFYSPKSDKAEDYVISRKVVVKLEVRQPSKRLSLPRGIAI